MSTPKELSENMQSQLEQDRKEEYRLDAEKDAESYDDEGGQE
jgi:hypothetical protein